MESGEVAVAGAFAFFQKEIWRERLRCRRPREKSKGKTWRKSKMQDEPIWAEVE